MLPLDTPAVAILCILTSRTRFRSWSFYRYRKRFGDLEYCSPGPTVKTAFSIQRCRSCYARLYLSQRPFYKILVKVRNSKKIVLIIVNINKDESKSLISNQFSLKKNYSSEPPPPPHTHFLENYFAEVKMKKIKTITNHF